jgi:phosphopantothenoylcysteine decarboxylase/phosphopantothenate--cysteine ligase
MHPAAEIRGIKSNMLSNKRIVLCVTGSIASVETVKLARELIRHGAEVFPVMTPSATKIIHPDALWFATGNVPVVELTGDTEHVSFCGKINDPVDLLLISPSTANTISKIAHGIDDTAVTTFATTAIGSGVPIIIVPAMHLSMYDHKIVQDNIEICKKLKINFIGPKIIKNKAKIAEIDEIVANIIKIIGKRDLNGERCLIIGGPTIEPIDDVRVITNRSSGITAVELAKNAFFRGADVELWFGSAKEPSPVYITTLNFDSINDIISLLENRDIKAFDIIVLCAALSDYLPMKVKGKISSEKEKIEIQLFKAPKIISRLRSLAPSSKIVGFKLEYKKEKINKSCFELLKKNNLDFVIGNTVQSIESDKTEIWIVDKNDQIFHKKGSKPEISDFIFHVIK